LRFMWTFAAKAMPGAVSLFGIRAVRLASLAGLIVLGIVSLFAAHLLGTEEMPRLPESGQAQAKPQASHQGKPSGETVIAKLDQAETVASAEPVPTPRQLAMMLAPALPEAPPRDEEPNLEGLSEIPKELIWNRPPDSEKKSEPKAFAAFSKAREVLPWGAVEPVPFAPLTPAPLPAHADGAKPAAAIQQSMSLPDSAQVGAWLKAKVTEIKGADRSRPLYHFELWLEPPAAVKQRLVGVAYAFNTPAIRPQAQTSSDKTSGFRISAGGLACADEITVTLSFDDGSVQKIAVDGCKPLS